MATWPHLIRPRAHARMLANAWTRASTNAHALTRTCVCVRKKRPEGRCGTHRTIRPNQSPSFFARPAVCRGGEGKRAREREIERDGIDKKEVRTCDMPGRERIGKTCCQDMCMQPNGLNQRIKHVEAKHQASALKKHPVHTSGSKASSKHTISVAQATPCTRKWKQRMKQAHQHTLPHQTTRTHSHTQGGPCPASFTHVQERGILYCARLSHMFR
jgi:hypothetical protein